MVPRLRATCHAGEDFAHPLEGIYCMDIARESLKLGPGDTIGHGLAAGWNVEAFDRERTPRAVIREGSLFDSLLWLRCEIGRWPSQLFAHLLPNLDAELRNLFIELYQEMGELPSLTTLGKLFQERAQPIPPNRCFCIPAERMRGMEVWNRACIERRARHVALPVKLLHELRPAITYAQAEVAKKLAEQGIALELNPSSNLRVSGALTLDELPFLQLLRRFGSFMLATLNTDNPGTFSTRIENEYALVTAALRATGVSRAETMEIVERLRRIGMYAMPWGHDPANREPGESCASAESSSLRGG